jgi:hypothetical protein
MINALFNTTMARQALRYIDPLLVERENRSVPFFPNVHFAHEKVFLKVENTYFMDLNVE